MNRGTPWMQHGKMSQRSSAGFRRWGLMCSVSAWHHACMRPDDRLPIKLERTSIRGCHGELKLLRVVFVEVGPCGTRTHVTRWRSFCRLLLGALVLPGTQEQMAVLLLGFCHPTAQLPRWTGPSPGSSSVSQTFWLWCEWVKSCVFLSRFIQNLALFIFSIFPVLIRCYRGCLIIIKHTSTVAKVTSMGLNSEK